MWSETTVKKTDQADTPKETKSGKFQTSTTQIFSLILRAFFPSELTVPQCPKNFEFLRLPAFFSSILLTWTYNSSLVWFKSLLFSSDVATKEETNSEESLIKSKCG